MRKIILSIALAVTLAGCAANIVNSEYNPLTRERLYAAEASYVVANKAALAYRSLRQCRKSEVVTLTNICRRYATTLALQAASRRVNTAFVAARKCLRDTTSSTDCVAGVEYAVASFRNDVSAAIGRAP